MLALGVHGSLHGRTVKLCFLHIWIAFGVCDFSLPLGISVHLKNLLFGLLKRNAKDRIEFGEIGVEA